MRLAAFRGQVVRVRRGAVDDDAQMAAQRLAQRLGDLGGAQRQVADVEDLPRDVVHRRVQHRGQRADRVAHMQMGAPALAALVERDAAQAQRAQRHRVDRQVEAHARRAAEHLAEPQHHRREAVAGQRQHRGFGVQHAVGVAGQRVGRGQLVQALAGPLAVDIAAADQQMARHAAAACQPRQPHLGVVMGQPVPARVQLGDRIARQAGQVDQRLHAGEVLTPQAANVHAQDLQPGVMRQLSQRTVPEQHAVDRRDPVPLRQQLAHQRRADVAGGPGDQDGQAAAGHGGRWSRQGGRGRRKKKCAPRDLPRMIPGMRGWRCWRGGFGTNALWRSDDV